MKTKKSLLAISIIVAMLLSAIPIARADFVSIQQVTPKSGSPGTTPLAGSIAPTRVDVTGQAEPHDLVKLTWDSHSISCTQADCTIKADVNGNYHIDFNVPQSVSGSHTVSVTNLNVTSLLPVSQSFTVNPVTELVQTSGHVGNSVKVLGTGFGPSSAVTTTYDGDSVTCTDSSGSGACQTDSNGSFSGSFAVPDSVTGKHDVRATDASANQARATFTVSRNVELTVTNPSLPQADQHAGFPVVGSVVQGRGTGFTSVEDVNVFFTSDPTGTVTGRSVGRFATNGKGTFTFTETIPPTPQLPFAGNDFSRYFYRANDTACTGAGCPAASVSLHPLLTLNPDHAAYNQQVNGIGQGFLSSTDVHVTLSNAVGCAPSGFADLHLGPTDSTGTFGFSFIIQQSSRAGPGLCPVTASQAGFSDKTRFILGTFLTTDPNQGIANDQTGNIKGTDVKVQGFVFSQNSAVDIKFDGNIVATATTDSNGDFTADFKVPEAFGGTKSDRVSAADHGTRCNGGTAACLAVASFTVVPWISLSQSSGKVGSQVTVYASGFGNVLTLSAGSVDFRYCGANAGSSTLARVPFRPDSAPFDQARVCTTIAVVPLIPSPTAPSGTLGTATSWTVYTTGSDISVGTASADSANPGSFKVTFAAPESWGGYHPISANELNSVGAVVRSSFNGALFRITPTISINPSSGQRDKIVTLQGTGFFQWEKYTTQVAGQEMQTFTESAGVVIDFGTIPRYVDQAHFIINNQVDVAWLEDIYRPIALNARGTIIYWDSQFSRLGSIGSQFLKVPSSEPQDGISITAYRFQMSTPTYSKDEATTSSFAINSPEITQVNKHTDDTVTGAVGTIQGTVNAARDMVMGVANMIRASTDMIPGVKTTTDTIKSTTDSLTTTANAIKASADQIPTIISTANAIKSTTDTVKSTTDSLKTTTDSLKATTDSLKSSTDSIKASADQIAAIKSTTDAIKANTDQVAAVKTTTDNIKADTSNLTNNTVPLVLQSPMGYLIVVLAAIAALGAVASALLISRRLQVVK